MLADSPGFRINLDQVVATQAGAVAAAEAVAEAVVAGAAAVVIEVKECRGVFSLNNALFAEPINPLIRPDGHLLPRSRGRRTLFNREQSCLALHPWDLALDGGRRWLC